MLELLKRKREEARKNNKGFTLMELLVVVAILGFLVAMLAPRYMNYTDRAMGTAAAADVRNIMTISTGRMMDTNTVPTVADLAASMNTTFSATSDKNLVAGATPELLTYTYTKNGVVIVAQLDISIGTISFDVDSVATVVTAVKKLNRVARGIGSGNIVTVKSVPFTDFNGET